MMTTKSLILLLMVSSSLTSCFPKVTLEELIARQAKVEQLLTSATLLMREENSDSLAQSEAQLRLALELAPEDVRVIDGLGCVAWRRKDLRRAEQYFRTAIEINPGYGRGIAHLAAVAKSRGNLREADRLYQLALEISPLDYRARNDRAALVLKSLNSADSRVLAERELRKALSLSGGNQEIIRANLRLLDRKGIEPDPTLR